MKKSLIGMVAASIMVAVTPSVKAEEIDQNTPAPQEVGTTIEFNVEPTYSITIPSSIKLSRQEDASYAGSGYITTTAIRLNKGATIDVTIESDFELSTAQGAAQRYVATMDEITTAIVSGATIAKFNTSEIVQSIQLNYTADNPRYAGEYSDTVIFTIIMNSNSK